MSAECERLGVPADVCRALAGGGGREEEDEDEIRSTVSSWTSSWTVPPTPVPTLEEERPMRSSTTSTRSTTTSSRSSLSPSSLTRFLSTTATSPATIHPLRSSSRAATSSAEVVEQQNSKAAEQGVNTPFVVLILVLVAIAGFYTWRRRKRASFLATRGGREVDSEKQWLAKPAETQMTKHDAEWLCANQSIPPPAHRPSKAKAPARPPRPSMAAKVVPRRQTSKRVPPPVVRESALLAATELAKASPLPYEQPSPLLDSRSSFGCRGDRRTAVTPLPPLPDLRAKPLPVVSASSTTGRLESMTPTMLLADEDDRPLAYAMKHDQTTYSAALRSTMAEAEETRRHPRSLMPGQGRGSGVMVPVQLSPGLKEREADSCFATDERYGTQSMQVPRSVGGFSMVSEGDEEELVPSRSRAVWPSSKSRPDSSTVYAL